MLRSSFPPTCPIIAYHKVSDKKEAGLTTVSPSTFEKQIRWLAEAGYTGITFKNLNAHDTLPEKPVIISFDDGYECIHRHAIPVLTAYGFTSVVYIITGYSGKYNTWEAVRWQQKYKHLDAGQIKELHGLGFEIGSHGKTHRFLPALSDDEVRGEAADSKKYLEDLTGGEIHSFCYPYGRYTQRVKDLIGESGYSYAIHNLCLLRRAQKDHLALMRRSIYLSDSIRIFKKKVKQPLVFSPHILQELLIQKGALAGIAINWLRGYSR
jgi:peptidoglycan/xylan/chitin deacetylase (PgdA/CDA1 family)